MPSKKPLSGSDAIGLFFVAGFLSLFVLAPICAGVAVAFEWSVLRALSLGAAGAWFMATLTVLYAVVEGERGGR